MIHHTILRQTARRFSSSTTARQANPLQHQTLTLRDGRTLGFAEYGDHHGKPLVYLHGFPSSRLEARDMESVATRLGIHLIAPDRPGFGRSSLRPPNTSVSNFPPRRFMDYPSDLSALADHLHLDRFSVLGGSGGGPFALACAHQLQSSRLHHVGLLASAGPWRIAPATPGGDDMSKELTKHTMWSSYFLYLAATHTPAALIASTNALLRNSNRILGNPKVEGWLDQWLEKVLKTRAAHDDPRMRDQPLSTETKASIPEIRKGLIVVFMEGFAQGSEGAVRDIHLLTQPWDIPLGEIKRPVKIWHGAKDVNSPVNQIRYLASQLSGAEYREYPEFDHFQLGTKIEEVLEEMVEGLPDRKG